MVALLALAILAVTCGPDPNAKLPSWITSKGGGTEAGAGGSGAGGTTTVGSGGRTTAGSGGTTVSGTGGRIVGSGGAKGTGGAIETGGTSSASGGRNGTGGRATDAGVDGRNRDTASGSGGSTLVGSGGSTTEGSGGRAGSGGRTGSGGAAGRDGGAGGVTGSGGATVPRDATGGNDTPVAASCYATLVDNGYACGSAAPCSACKVNNVSKQTECESGIDCLAAAGPSCDSNCQLTCLNKAGDAQVGACITALTKAACGGTGC